MGFAGPTVTVVCADTVVLLLLASAVYVVVLAGFTVAVPPVVASVYELPSDPVTFTLVALVALTVSVSELPLEIVLFCALTDTVGFAGPTVTVVCAVVVPLPFVAEAV
jgi:hypothetical protein